MNLHAARTLQLVTHKYRGDSKCLERCLIEQEKEGISGIFEGTARSNLVSLSDLLLVCMFQGQRIQENKVQHMNASLSADFSITA